jgi:hypothetical protein
MRYTLYVGEKEKRFYSEAGWFRGEDFVIIKVELFNIQPDIEMLTIFRIQIAKLVLDFGFVKG